MTELTKKIRNKLRDYKRIDAKKKIRFPELNDGLETITMKDACKLIDDLKSDICCMCNCKMEFTYKSWCVYQFSFDRIDERKIHAITNLQIICFNCNSSGYGSVKSSCSRGCHINDNPKIIPETYLRDLQVGSFETILNK